MSTDAFLRDSLPESYAMDVRETACHDCIAALRCMFLQRRDPLIPDSKSRPPHPLLPAVTAWIYSERGTLRGFVEKKSRDFKKDLPVGWGPSISMKPNTGRQKSSQLPPGGGAGGGGGGLDKVCDLVGALMCFQMVINVRMEV